MKARFCHWYNALAATLLSLLGFSSCSNDAAEDGNFELLYGTPTATFQVKGKVTNESGQPVKGILVVTQHGIKDSTYTDENGQFVSGELATTSVDYMLKKGKLEVTFEDVDGNENGGTFANDTVTSKDITDVKQTKKGDGSWYLGAYELTANKQLKKK